MTPDEEAEAEIEIARARALKARTAPSPVAPEDEAGVAALNERQRSGGSPAERRWGQIVSFLSGSPAFGTVSRAADSLTGQNSQRSAQRATEQFSPKLAGVPVLPVLGGMVATAPAGAANIAPRAGAALLGGRAAMGARVGLQAGIGGAQAADRGGDAGDVALGTGVGAVAGGLGEGVGAGLSRLGQAARPAMEKFANTQAVKALLGGGAMVNRLKNQLGVGSEAEMQALGADVRGLGVLSAGPIPRSAQGVNEAVQGRMAGEGAEIGRIRELADALVASGKASPPDAVKLAQAYERGVLGAARIADEAEVAPDVAARSIRLIQQATPKQGGVPTTEGGTFKGMWDQTSNMQKSAFSSLDPPVTQAARKTLERAGVRSARDELATQMEGAVGPDEMASLREAMKRYSTAARIADTVEDTAGRATSRNAIGLGDHQLAQTVGATGPVGLGVAGLSSLVRGRANSAAATYAPMLGRAAGPALGVAGGVSRFAAPAAARQSISDPLGPLREYLGLSPEERLDASAQAFGGSK